MIIVYYFLFFFFFFFWENTAISINMRLISLLASAPSVLLPFEWLINTNLLLLARKGCLASLLLLLWSLSVYILHYTPLSFITCCVVAQPKSQLATSTALFNVVVVAVVRPKLNCILPQHFCVRFSTRNFRSLAS